MKATAGGSGGLLFDDQLQQIVTWFDGWNDCERTEALHTLLDRLAPIQGRFLSHCIQNFHAGSYELPLLENRANSSNYLESLHGLSPETAASPLLQNLPLLRPGDDEIRARYLALVQDVLSYALRRGTLYTECRQILSYSLMHPAFSAGDRTALKRWTQRFDDFAISNFGIVTATASSAAAITTTSNGSNSNGGVGMSNGHDQQHSHSQMQFILQQQQQSNATSKVSPTYAAQSQQQVSVSRLDNWTNGSSVGEAPLSPPSLVSPASAGALNGGSVRSTSIGGSADHQTGGSYLDRNNINQVAGRLNAVSFYTPPPPLKSDATSTMVEPNKPYCTSSQDGGFLNGRAKRSNSLTPPSTSSSSTSSLSSVLNGCNGGGLSYGPCSEELSRVKPRSMSLSSCSGGPLSPNNLVSSGSGSDGHLDGSLSFDNVGMKAVPSWLKGLRLHKYTRLFSGLTYNEMFEITEDSLAAKDITKGARNKIMVSIQKLRDRHEALRSLEKTLQEGGSIRTILMGFGSVIDTPLIAFQSDSCVDSVKRGDEITLIQEGDLPAQITHLFGKISTQLLHRQLEDDTMRQFLDLIEKCLNHEAFNELQKKRLNTLSQQVREEYRSLVPRRGSDYRHNRGRLNRNYVCGYGNGVVSDFGQFNKYGSFAVGSSNHLALERRRISGPMVLQSTTRPSTDYGNYFHHEQQQQQQRRSSPAVLVSGDLSRSPPPIAVDHPLLINHRLSMPGLYNKRGSLQENNSHSLLMRTKSAPNNTHNQYQLFGNGKLGGSGIISTESDFIDGLESVSRSVADHALGDSG